MNRLIVGFCLLAVPAYAGPGEYKSLQAGRCAAPIVST